MSALFALGAAVAWGAADFLGGLLARRMHVLTVVVLSHAVSVVVLLPAFALYAGDPLTSAALRWGAAAGVASAAGVVLLYRGLAVGTMSIVAPITGVVAAGLPVMIGIGTGERPGRVALAGIAVALVAVVLVPAAPAHASAPPGRPRGIAEAIGAGIGFAFVFVSLENAGGGSGLWPVVMTRVVAFGIFLAAATAVRRVRLPSRADAAGIAAAGVLDVAANTLFLLATRRGLLSIVAVLSSMYPAGTVLLARAVVGERLSRLQLAGLVLAAAAIALIALG